MDADTGKKIIISEREEISFSNNKIVSFLLKNVIGLKNNYEIIGKPFSRLFHIIYLKMDNLLDKYSYFDIIWEIEFWFKIVI